MLDMYKSLQANGVIGPMMKVDSAGKMIVDVKGELPGQLVPRPFQEFPKVIRRTRADGVTIEKIVNSKSEELKLIAEAPDEAEVRSPLERERDQLAQTVAEQDKALGQQQTMLQQMADNMAKLMAQVEQMSGKSMNDLPPPVKSSAEAELSLDAEARAVSGSKPSGFGRIGKN